MNISDIEDVCRISLCVLVSLYHSSNFFIIIQNSTRQSRIHVTWQFFNVIGPQNHFMDESKKIFFDIIMGRRSLVKTSWFKAKSVNVHYRKLN